MVNMFVMGHARVMTDRAVITNCDFNGLHGVFCLAMGPTPRILRRLMNVDADYDSWDS